MKNKTTKSAIAVQTGYEGKVIREALLRAGKNPHLKGHIHELLLRDRLNLRPEALLNGERASLVRAPNARAVDLVIKRGGKVIQRIQAKDTPMSISKTLRQMQSGHYRSARVLGTDETVRAFGGKAVKAACKKGMQPSGVSSRYTESLAQRAGASGSGSLAGAAGTAARVGAQWGGAASAGIALVRGVKDLADGRRDLGEVAVDVAKEGAGGALSGAAASAAATVAGSVAAAGVAAAGMTGIGAAVLVVGAPVVVAIGVGFGVKSVWDWLWE